MGGSAGSMGGSDGLQAEELVDPFAAYANFQGKPYAEVKAELQKMHPGLRLRAQRARSLKLIAAQASPSNAFLRAPWSQWTTGWTAFECISMMVRSALLHS